MDAGQSRVRVVLGAGLHGVGADDGREDADAPDQERENDALVTEAGEPEDHGGDDRDLVALEDVCSHAGAVPHVVADVVCDGGGVAGVVLRDPLFKLPHQIGPDVRRLRVDAAADPHKQGKESTAKAEPQERFVGLVGEDDEDQRTTEES